MPTKAEQHPEIDAPDTPLEAAAMIAATKFHPITEKDQQDYGDACDLTDVAEGSMIGVYKEAVIIIHELDTFEFLSWEGSSKFRMQKLF